MSDNKKISKKLYFYVDTIVSNPDLNITTKFVASVLLFKFHNTANGACFPSEGKIANAAGLSERVVRRAIAQLRDNGSVRVKRRYNTSNEYFFDFNEDKSVLIDPNLMRTNLVSNEDVNVLSNEDKFGLLTLESNTGNNSLSERENFSLHKNMNSSLPNNKLPFKREGNNPSLHQNKTFCTHEASDLSLHQNKTPFTREANNPYSHTDNQPAVADWFEQFWAVYPRHVGRNEAMREFAAALKRGVDPEQIIQAAAGYAQTRKKKKQPEFDKYPANWLKGEHWNDEHPHTFKQQEPPKNRNTMRCDQCSKVVVTESRADPFYCRDCQAELDEFAAELMQECSMLEPDE